MNGKYCAVKVLILIFHLTRMYLWFDAFASGYQVVWLIILLFWRDLLAEAEVVNEDKFVIIQSSLIMMQKSCGAILYFTIQFSIKCSQLVIKNFQQQH